MGQWWPVMRWSGSLTSVQEMRLREMLPSLITPPPFQVWDLVLATIYQSLPATQLETHPLLQSQYSLRKWVRIDLWSELLDFLSPGPPAPSAAPVNVTTSSTHSSITVQWGMVPCADRNGDITGYSVRYGVQGSSSTQTVNITGASTTATTISNLMPSTNYSIQVAAVNEAGTGVYSDNISAETEGMRL